MPRQAINDLSPNVISRAINHTGCSMAGSKRGLRISPREVRIPSRQCQNHRLALEKTVAALQRGGEGRKWEDRVCPELTLCTLSSFARADDRAGWVEAAGSTRIGAGCTADQLPHEGTGSTHAKAPQERGRKEEEPSCHCPYPPSDLRRRAPVAAGRRKVEGSPGGSGGRGAGRVAPEGRATCGPKGFLLQLRSTCLLFGLGVFSSTCSYVSL